VCVLSNTIGIKAKLSRTHRNLGATLDTKDKLARLFQYQCKKDVLELEKKELRDSVESEKKAAISAILTPEIRQKLDAIELEASNKLNSIDAEYEGRSEAVDQNIVELTSEIKQDVIAGGESVKTNGLMALYVKGRVTWDTRAVEGFAMAHPELMAYRKEGEPSVTFRKTEFKP
jgi:hypothetical protein